jgi:diaminopimelate epimerase
MSGTYFWKYHGIGNDFVILDRTGGGRPVSAPDAVRICDRHRGVGADGVLTLLPSAKASFRMHIRNSDGSIAEMCGNGIRCAVKFAVERAGAEARGGDRAVAMLKAVVRNPGRGAGVRAVSVETGRGVLQCLAMIRGSEVESVVVDMGAPILDRSGIPMKGKGRFVGGKVEALGKTFKATAVGMGNPHLVLFHRDDMADALKFGPMLERSPLFPKRTNVEFARAVSGTKIHAVVWERGVGITEACGTGACATAVAFALAGISPFGTELSVGLPGGVLWITVPEDLGAVYMRGPAEEVFTGAW